MAVLLAQTIGTIPITRVKVSLSTTTLVLIMIIVNNPRTELKITSKAKGLTYILFFILLIFLPTTTLTSLNLPLLKSKSSKDNLLCYFFL